MLDRRAGRAAAGRADVAGPRGVDAASATATAAEVRDLTDARRARPSDRARFSLLLGRAGLSVVGRLMTIFVRTLTALARGRGSGLTRR